MRNDRLTQQYQGQPRGNKLAVRKNLCSTENCKPSRIISILCCLAFVFGILQYMILKENHNINEEHGKIIKNKPTFGDPVDSDLPPINT